jgi:hypothetical protein
MFQIASEQILVKIWCLKYKKIFKTLIISRFQGTYCCAHKTATLTSIQHTVSHPKIGHHSHTLPYVKLRTMGHMCKWKLYYGLFATHSLTYSNFHNIKVTWDWVILGLTFYTVIMVPFNLAVYRTGYTSTGDITFLGKLHF